jgi:hypothetical protein
MMEKVSPEKHYVQQCMQKNCVQSKNQKSLKKTLLHPHTFDKVFIQAYKLLFKDNKY